MFAQATGSVWEQPHGSTTLWAGIIGTLIVGILMLVGLMYAPVRLRRPVVAGLTFISGLIYILVWLWPAPVGRGPGDAPANWVDGFGFFLSDTVGRVGSVASDLTAILLGLGAFSLLRLHFGKIAKKQADWGFSIVLLLSMSSMLVIGYWDWIVKQGDKSIPPRDFGVQADWYTINFAQDLFFDGLLQKMDAAMFSVIAFFILSAAYRAFRIRSIEATILLATALIVMLSLLAFVDLQSTNFVAAISGNDPNSPLTNLKLNEIATWIRTAFQSPGIRAIDFGIGIGALAMGLRLWLSLERGGASS